MTASLEKLIPKSVKSVCLAGIVWNTEKYHGSPLELSDERLGNLATWVQHHNITVVKLDCLVKDGTEEWTIVVYL